MERDGKTEESVVEELVRVTVMGCGWSVTASLLVVSGSL